MDYLLLEKLGEDFTKKFGCDPRKQVRCRLRMLDIIEKQRKILSANLEATVHLESLLEDEDLHRNIKRAEFEEMIQPIIIKLGEVMQDALNKSGKLILTQKSNERVEGVLFMGAYPSLLAIVNQVLSS